MNISREAQAIKRAITFPADPYAGWDPGPYYAMLRMSTDPARRDPPPDPAKCRCNLCLPRKLAAFRAKAHAQFQGDRA